ncbi:ras-related GTP-binding protein A-like protein [Chytriomyces sp. MP71]|nr:ras-related GTP-binding protein A-like protein [Chytriomyces sp. MP71]
MKKKVLLMGKSGAGKTSMRSIIFANYIARDTRRLGATIDIEHSHVRFLGNLVLNLWDCGGQDVFMESYFASQKDQIFRNVEVLIYIFDVESRELEKDLAYFSNSLDAVRHNSQHAQIFCLVHKMDLVVESARKETFRNMEDQLKKRAAGMNIMCFGTSIWDETLYKAWSSIVYSLIPNVKHLETQLENFCRICDADEIILFERTTFLVISHSTPGEFKQNPAGQSRSTKLIPDANRFEKVSNIIKQFKLSCSKNQAQFQCMEVRRTGFSAYVDVLTPNTYVMVIVSDDTIQSAAMALNINSARKHFQKIEESRG